MKKLWFVIMVLLMACAGCSSTDPDVEPFKPDDFREQWVGEYDVVEETADTLGTELKFLYRVKVELSDKGNNYLKVFNLLDQGRTVDVLMLSEAEFHAPVMVFSNFRQQGACEILVTGDMEEEGISFSWNEAKGKLSGSGTGVRRKEQ